MVRRHSFTVPAVLLSAFVALTVSFGGKIEGRYFPVVTDAIIIQTEPDGDTWTRFWGSFVKRRDCDFDGIAWRLHIGENTAIADFRFDEGVILRSPGGEPFGPWLVQLSTEQLMTRASATVFHRCHWLWRTETVFYTAD